jgi:hypothetical protein
MLFHAHIPNIQGPSAFDDFTRQTCSDITIGKGEVRITGSVGCCRTQDTVVFVDEEEDSDSCFHEAAGLRYDTVEDFFQLEGRGDFTTDGEECFEPVVQCVHGRAFHGDEGKWGKGETANKKAVGGREEYESQNSKVKGQKSKVETVLFFSRFSIYPFIPLSLSFLFPFSPFPL